MAASLRHRRLEGELMDDPLIRDDLHIKALRGLRRINAVSRTAESLWPGIARYAEAHPGRTLSLLDVATGGGDVAIALAQRARQANLPLVIEGCDISPTALRFAAQEAEAAREPIRFFGLDVISEALPARYDIIICSLFLHHLTNARIVALLRNLAEHAEQLIVSDLLRTYRGYGLAYLGTRLLSTSRIVHEDGLRSVSAALSLPEARILAAEAGLDDAFFMRCWPSRFLMTWRRARQPQASNGECLRECPDSLVEGAP